MQLSHSFTVPSTLERTWQTLMDLELVGGCFPGATVTEVTAEGFTGTVKVKLGPIALVYAGSGSIVERDDTAYRAVIDAKGKDKRGNGTAGAMVTMHLTSEGDGSTRAEVATDLSVTGKPAQFGRGVMQDVSDKLLHQFIACIEDRLGEGSPAATGSTPAPVAQQEASAAGPRHPAPALTAVGPPARQAGADDAIDLGSTVLPVLVKNYGKQALGLVAVVVVAVVLFRWLRR